MMLERVLDIDCLSAARRRIRNIFANGLPVYLSFSGGKDSLVLAHITTEMIRQGEIDPRLLRVEFIDEEAIFPCIERVVKDWRERFLLMGAQFAWYCLEVKHFSCLNMLENDETFICWDRFKRPVWTRQPPSFAICSHPSLIPRKDTYQQFLARLKEGVHMTGVRASESMQRRQFLGVLSASGISAATGTIHPLYDWIDDDVWLYLSRYNIVVPDAYVHLYQIGVPRRNLRISQFFSIDTVPTLARIAEFYPNMMERILKREPSAYLVSLYWNSEMFRRRTPTRTKIEQHLDVNTNWRQRMLDMLANPPPAMTRSRAALGILRAFQSMILKIGGLMTEDHCKTVCDALTAGDPKQRVKRSILSQVTRDGANAIKASKRGLAVAAAASHQRPAGAA